MQEHTAWSGLLGLQAPTQLAILLPHKASLFMQQPVGCRQVLLELMNPERQLPASLEVLAGNHINGLAISITPIPLRPDHCAVTMKPTHQRPCLRFSTKGQGATSPMYSNVLRNCQAVRAGKEICAQSETCLLQGCAGTASILGSCLRYFQGTAAVCQFCLQAVWGLAQCANSFALQVIQIERLPFAREFKSAMPSAQRFQSSASRPGL